MSIEPTPSSNVPAEIPSDKDERTMAMLCHLGGAFLGFLVPLIVWLIKKDQSRFVDDQGKEALNFHITILIGHAVGGATICLTFGLLNLAVYVVAVVFGVMAGIAANKGEVYRYPLNIRLI